MIEIIIQGAALAELHDDKDIGVCSKAIEMLDEIRTWLLDHPLCKFTHHCDFIALIAHNLQIMVFISSPYF